MAPNSTPNGPFTYEHRLQDTPNDSMLRQSTPQPSDPLKGTPASNLPKTLRILDTWFYEILATIFSVGCFVAILGVLLAFDGKPTPKFAYSLTLNTVISILATASKASLVFMIGECTGQLKWLWFYNKGAERKRRLDGMQLFDSASRGPLGAFWVLFEHKGRSLVSLGALVMILSTPYDAFVQQILTYPIRNTVLATNSAQAPASRAVSLLLPLLADDEEDIVQIGQWSDNFLVSPTCPSGNCTWPPFQSVEMCSQCSEITSETYIQCATFPANTTLDEFDGATRSCSIISPHGSGRMDITLYEASGAGDGGYFYMDVPDEVVGSQILSGFAETDMPYPAVAMVHAEVGVANKSQYYDGYPRGLDVGTIFEVVKATECTLNLCARTYNLTTMNGVVDLRKSEPDYGRQFWINNKNGTIYPGKRADEFDLGDAMVRTNHSTCWRPSSGDEPDSAVELAQPTNTTWVDASRSAFCPVSEFVAAGFLEGEKRVAFNSSDGVAIPERIVDAAIKRIRTVGLDESMRRIAASYTKQALLASNTTVDATVYVPEVYVSVEWLWILHPAALTALAVVFLASTMFVNRRQGLKLWKTSILAVLYHGLTRFGGEDEYATEEDRNATVSRMGQTAQGVRVRLTTVDEKRGLMLD
ncbi:hypothetical protein BJY00DRAFT_312991 [Aspergillus carlsbadensis]|nr:hypothetical protein BJY00DRAFT_312991 [Aspergillus carlsbadensis]